MKGIQESDLIFPRLKKTDVRVWITLASAFLFGLAAHGMGMMNKYSFHDDVYFMFQLGTTVELGRWMLQVLDGLEIAIFGDGHYSLPLVNGLFSLLCAGGMACLLVDLLKIRKPLYCAALGALMAIFPVVTALFGFVYAMPCYLLAMLMTVFSAWLICRKQTWWSRVLAAVLAGCAVGVYQAVIPLLLTVLLLFDLRYVAEEQTEPREFLLLLLVQAACVAAAMALYWGMNRLFLALYHTHMDNYQGVAEAGSLSVDVYLSRVGRAYQEFFHPTRNTLYDMYPMHTYYTYYAMLAADILLALRLILRTWKENRSRAVVLLLLLALVPLGCEFIYVMAGEVHGLMLYAEVLQVALFVWLADRMDFVRPKVRRLLSQGAAVLLSLTCVLYIRFDNQCYLKMELEQQQAVSYYTTLITRIKSAPGYRDELPVLFLNPRKIQDQTLYDNVELSFISLNTYDAPIQDYLNDYAWLSFMKRWCAFNPELFVDQNGAVESLPEVQALPHYPDDGSIQVIQDVVVVNF